MTGKSTKTTTNGGLFGTDSKKLPIQCGFFRKTSMNRFHNRRRTDFIKMEAGFYLPTNFETMNNCPRHHHGSLAATQTVSPNVFGVTTGTTTL